MVDLGAGVHEYPDPPDDRRRGPGPPRQLACPLCGAIRGHVRVSHPGGDWLCECGQLFDGSTQQWWALEDRRNHLHARRERAAAGARPEPEPTSHRPAGEGDG